MTRTFGRHLRKDKRNADYPVKLRPTDRTYRYWNAKRHLDQGDTPMCVGFAGAHWLACAPYRMQHVTGEGLYWAAQRDDEWSGESYDGSSVLGLARSLHRFGAFEEYRWADTAEQVVNHLLTTGPVLLGTDWFEGMEEPDETGGIYPYGELLGGHAYIADGIRKSGRHAQFKWRIRIKNSWGLDWGNKGHAYLHEMSLDDLLKRDGEALVAVPFGK